LTCFFDLLFFSRQRIANLSFPHMLNLFIRSVHYVISVYRIASLERKTCPHSAITACLLMASTSLAVFFGRVTATVHPRQQNLTNPRGHGLYAATS
jgi:hypothetical protein